METTWWVLQLSPSLKIVPGTPCLHKQTNLCNIKELNRSKFITDCARHTMPRANKICLGEEKIKVYHTQAGGKSKHTICCTAL